jgi:hypothetical protein
LEAQPTALALVVGSGVLLQEPPRKVPDRLANRDEPDAERRGRGAAEHEAPRLDGCDMRDAVFLIGPNERENAAVEQLAVGEQAPHIGMAVDPRNARAQLVWCQ